MNKYCIKRLGIVLASLLSGCSGAGPAEPPPPISLNDEATGHYCMMGLFEHEGPKAQVHVVGFDEPIWFTQIRDAITYLRSAEETAEVLAVYVSDMGSAVSWAEPGADNWVDANQASFVIDSQRVGSMGSPEAVPFATQEAAAEFVAEHGGTMTTLSDIPDDYVLSAVDLYLQFKSQKNSNKPSSQDAIAQPRKGDERT